MAGADEKVAEMKPGVKRAGIDAALLGVIVELPFQIAVAAGAHTQPRDYRRKSARFSNKGNAGKIYGRGEDVARSVHNCAAESWVDKILHFDFPAHKIIRSRRCTGSSRRNSLRGGSGSAARGFLVAAGPLPLGKKPLQKAEFNFIGVAENV